jgi:hypothetical protein
MLLRMICGDTRLNIFVESSLLQFRCISKLILIFCKIRSCCLEILRNTSYNNNNNNNTVEPEMYDYTSNNWSHWNSNEKLKEESGSCTRKTFDSFTTKDSYTWNITHNAESTAV